MIKKIKKFFEDIIRHQLSGVNNRLDDILSSLSEPDDNASITMLMRHCLGSIDLSDIKENDFEDGNDRKEYLSKIASVVLPIVENRAKILINRQKDFISTEANGTDQMWFARGSINGLILILESFEKDRDEFLEMTKPAEKFDKQKVIDSVVIN